MQERRLFFCPDMHEPMRKDRPAFLARIVTHYTGEIDGWKYEGGRCGDCGSDVVYASEDPPDDDEQSSPLTA